MKALECSLVAGVLLCALCALVAASPGAMPVPIPPQLRSAVLKISVNSTPCSVTCGPGLKVEEMCEVSPAGQLRNCSLLRSLCLSGWSCGLHHVAVPAGRPIRLSCAIPDSAGVGNHTYSYSWTWSPGLITTNDLLFQPLRKPQPVLSLATAAEGDGGTYRCDVRVTETSKLVKRISFGVKVIPGDLVDLSFQKSLSWQQKVAAHLEGGSARSDSREGQGWFWERRVYEIALGIGSGVIGGVLLSLLLCCCQRLWRRRGAEK